MRTATRKMTDDPVVHRILDQLKLQTKTEKDLERYLGLSNGSISAWKFANVKTYVKQIDRITEYLGVSKEYLLEGTDEYVNKDTLTATEIKLIKTFRLMGNEQQKCFMKNGEFLVMSTKYERMDAIMSDDILH